MLLNSWEAFYMDFTGEDIVGMARQAADLGIDLRWRLPYGQTTKCSIN